MGLFRKKEPVQVVRHEYDSEYEFNLAGAHLKSRQKIVVGLQPGEPLELVREPENRYDKHAIAVYARGQQVGYIPRDRARMFCDFIGGGNVPEAVLTGLEWYENDDGDQVCGARIFVGFNRPN